MSLLGKMEVTQKARESPVVGPCGLCSNKMKKLTQARGNTLGKRQGQGCLNTQEDPK